jgi:hypothetical protein
VRVLFLGDVVGEPGRRAIARLLPELLARHEASFVIANGENAAGGFGITPALTRELLGIGVDVITLGNHVWKRREVVEALEQESRLLRPANYPPEVPGRGGGAFSAGKETIGVVNVCGRVFMDALDCPFRAAEAELSKLRGRAKALIVDMHAEATSEKEAMGWYLDGRVSAVIGTHTHVQTADERLLPKGTAYITDVGMTGPRDSIIGGEPEPIVRRFLTQVPQKFQVAKGAATLNAVVIELDPTTGTARSISRIAETIEN